MRAFSRAESKRENEREREGGGRGGRGGSSGSGEREAQQTAWLWSYQPLSVPRSLPGAARAGRDGGPPSCGPLSVVSFSERAHHIVGPLSSASPRRRVIGIVRVGFRSFTSRSRSFDPSLLLLHYWHKYNDAFSIIVRVTLRGTRGEGMGNWIGGN